MFRAGRDAADCRENLVDCFGFGPDARNRRGGTMRMEPGFWAQMKVFGAKARLNLGFWSRRREPDERMRSPGFGARRRIPGGVRRPGSDHAARTKRWDAAAKKDPSFWVDS